MTNKEAIEKLLAMKKCGGLGDKDRQALNLAIKALEERPTGKWIVDYQENEDALFKHGWKCPVCETRNTYGMPPYCMYCGAKLEKAEKE